ncbi:MAG: ATP-binding protein, partial [Bacteroidota bacterium]
VMFTEDITERKLQEQALQIATIKAEEGSRAKQQFLANMSHEIRTPMNAILGMTRLLQRTNPSNQQKTYLDAIKASADNLLVIINDILDISKIEAGKLNIESVGFNLEKLVKRLCDSIEFRANEKGIGLFDYVDRRISKVLIGDPVRLNQVMLNLVNNSIKFTEKGSVEIECNLIEATEDENVIQFQVIDTGIGIDKAKLATIFESFSQGDDSISREYGGTGLGLSISNQLVELFGGKLQVKTKRAIGTTFYFTLRMKVGSEEHIPKPLEAKRKDVSIRGLKVLLAEDHDINQYLATTLLDEWGTVVEVVENGKEVIKKVSDHQYDAILMDIQMPIMDGIDATKIIRRQLRLDVPIIAFTANSLKGDSHKYLNAGMNAYVSKPFEPVELFNTIATVANLDEGPKSPLRNEEESDILKVLPDQKNNSQEEMLRL